MYFKVSILSCFLLLLIIVSIAAQSQHFIIRTKTLIDNLELSKTIDRLQNLRDSISFIRQTARFAKSLRQRGYITANEDSILLSGDSLIVYLHIGKKYQWLQLAQSNLPDELLSKANFKARFFEQKPVRFSQLQKLLDDVVEAAVSSGYPFANIQLSGVQVDDEGHIKASLQYESGKFMCYGTFLLPDSLPVKTKFLSAYLNFRKGHAFSQKQFNQFDRKLRRLPYVKSLAKPLPVFRGDSVYVRCFLKKRKANSLHLLLGLLPNASMEGSLLLTGELTLSLQNPFRSGKRIQLNWQRLQEQSQLFTFDYTHPNLLNTGFDIQLGVRFFRDDTIYQNFDRYVHIAHQTVGLGKLTVKAKWHNGNAPNTGVNLAETPEVLGNNWLSVGLAYEFNSLDDAFLPRRGFLLSLNFAAANKNLQLEVLSDSIGMSFDRRSLQLTYRLETSKFFKLSTSMSLLLRNRSACISNRALFLNDLYRLGGINSIRGFNENSFFGATYSINTVESRFFFDTSSYLFLFVDQAYIERKTLHNAETILPLGMGGGLRLDVRNSVLTIAYALGLSESNNLSLSESKIHLSFASRF